MKLMKGNVKGNLSKIKEVCVRLNISPIQRDLLLAQAILESNLLSISGPSKLALEHCNLFGIKYPSSKKNIEAVKALNGSPVNMSTIEYTSTKIKADFIKFPDIESCIKYREYMLTWDLYKDIKKASTFEEACKMVAKSWATDPSYAKKLIALKVLL